MKKILIIISLIIGGISNFANAEDYTFSMLPRYFPEKLTAMVTPLTTYLTETLQSPVKLVLTENFDKYTMQVVSGTVDIGYENPLVYTQVSDQHEVIATAQMGADGNKFRGIIITSPNSDIKSIADLQGKKVMIVGKTSAGGYLSQKLALQEAGLDPERDCTIVEAANNHQENVIISVSIGDVDAGFIRESAYHVADEFIMPNSIKEVVATNWLPNWALSVNKSMAPEKKEQIRAAVLKLQADHPALKAMGLTGFEKASDSDYDVIRKLLD